MDLNKDLEQAKKDYGASAGSSTDWFKFQEGDNRLRVLTEGYVLADHYKKGVCYGMHKGCPHHDEDDAQPSVKWLLWIWDKSDGKVKLAKFPYKVMQGIDSYKKDEEWAFSEFPMPYDLVINAENAGTTNVSYTVKASPKREDVTSDVLEKLEKENSTEEIVEKMKDKQEKEDEENGRKSVASKEELEEAARNTQVDEGLDQIEYPENTDDVPFPDDN